MQRNYIVMNCVSENKLSLHRNVLPQLVAFVTRHLSPSVTNRISRGWVRRRLKVEDYRCE